MNFRGIRKKRGARLDTVSAILLAAGESKRMGKPKLLLPLGDSTILERAVDNLLNSNLGD